MIDLRSLQGRIPRRVFLLECLLPLGLIWVGTALYDGISGAPIERVYYIAPLLVLALFVFWLFTVGIVKRLHDLGVSGWVWAVVFLGGRLLDGLSPSASSGLAATVLLVLQLAWLGLVILAVFARGASGANKYGPDPLGVESA